MDLTVETLPATENQAMDNSVTVLGDLKENVTKPHKKLAPSTAIDGVVKVYPTEEELGTVNTCLRCPEDNCSSVFSSESNLKLHLIKSHKKTGLLKSSNVKKIFFCPIAECIYHCAQHFTTLKLVKQHYLKVHSPKKWFCSICNKGFPTESYKKTHEEYCEVVFSCDDCEMSYTSYEALKTHSRRKGHNIKAKSCFKPSQPKKTVIVISKSETDLNSNLRPILPKTSSSVQLVFVPCVGQDMKDQGNQTEEDRVRKNRRIVIHRSSLGLHQTTQTFGAVKPQLTVETQTIGDFLRREDDDKKSIKTQTNSVDSKTTSSNTCFNMNDFEFSINVDIERSSSSTQTSIQSQNPMQGSIHTDTADLLPQNLENLESFDANFFNCNTETQTDFMLNDELFNYCDYYSNMCTQTCEDVLLNGLAFNDIETQTVDDVLKSVESQTMMSQCKKIPLSCRDMSHTETQTDMEMMQMLEEINA